MRVEYHPATASDLNEAASHYDEQRQNLGNYLRVEVYATIRRIRNAPLAYRETNGVRRALVKRFPYSVVYRIVGDEAIRILLIRHHKRHENYGAGRQ